MKRVKSGNPEGGAPTIVFEDADIVQIEALGAVLKQGMIADYFGISENSLLAVFERQPEVFAAFKRGKARAVANVATTLLGRARNGDLGAMCFYLKTQGGYRERSALDITDESGVLRPTTITLVSKRSDDDP